MGGPCRWREPAWAVRPTYNQFTGPKSSDDRSVFFRHWCFCSPLCARSVLPLEDPCGVNQNPPLKTPKQCHQLPGLSPQLLQASPPEETLALLRNTCIEVGGSSPDEDRVLFLMFYTKKPALLVQHCYSKAHSFPLDQLLKTPVPPARRL